MEVHICVCSFGWLDCLFAWFKILYRDGTNACTRHIFLGQKESYVARDNGSSHWTSTWQFNWNLFIGKQKSFVYTIDKCYILPVRIFYLCTFCMFSCKPLWNLNTNHLSAHNNSHTQCIYNPCTLPNYRCKLKYWS